MNVSNKIKSIIAELAKENKLEQEKGYGPFGAAICDENENIIIKAHNSVMIENLSVCHAEVNAIKEIQKKYKTYDLSKYNLSICITAEPCVMCIGAIMWSGIKKVYYGLSSKEVEQISGFIEGYKPNWEEYFKNIGINVHGGIETDICKDALQHYVKMNKTIYKPQRLN